MCRAEKGKANENVLQDVSAVLQLMPDAKQVKKRCKDLQLNNQQLSKWIFVIKLINQWLRLQQDDRAR